MPRLARIVVPGLPHHVTQRGNRRQTTFFHDRDYALYLDLLRTASVAHDVEVLAYCLMPNHVHIVAVPVREESLRLAMADAHERYTTIINARQGWQGSLWQGRFWSVPMDEPHLHFSVRYVEMNPVRAGICTSPFAYRWSSARAHLSGIDDGVCSVAPMLHRISDWESYLRVEADKSDLAKFRKHARTGRPLGSDEFIRSLESATGRTLVDRRRGRRLEPPLDLPPDAT